MNTETEKISAILKFSEHSDEESIDIKTKKSLPHFFRMSYDELILYLQKLPIEYIKLAISVIDMGIGAYNVLTANRITQVQDLFPYQEADLLRMRNMGKTKVNNLKQGLAILLNKWEKNNEFTIPAIENKIPTLNWDFEHNIDDNTILEVKLSDITSLPVRAINTLKNANIYTIDDLIKISKIDLLRKPNCGQKTLKDIEKSIFKYIADLKNSQTEIIENLSLDFLNENKIISDIHYEIIKRRFGFYGEEQTLEAVGEIHGITRERVRQVSTKSIDKLRKNIKYRVQIIEKITVLHNEHAPLEIGLIPYLDDFFSAYQGMDIFLKNCITQIFCPYLYAIKYQNETYLSTIAQKDFDGHISVISDFSQYQSMSVELMEYHIKKQCGQANIETFCNLIKDNIKKKILINQDDGIIMGNKKSARDIVSMVLKNAETPLHYTEVHSRCLQLKNKIDERRVHSLCGEVGILYGRGIYGNEKHFKIDFEICNVILEKAVHIIKQKNKQTHSQVILENLKNLYDIPDNLDSYKLEIILYRSNEVKPLGKSTWIYSDVNAEE